MLRPHYRSLLLAATLLAPLACKDSTNGSATDITNSSITGGDSSTGAATTTTGTTASPTTTDDPTSPPPTTTDPTTTLEPTTGGPPPTVCTSLTDELVCKNTDDCKWGAVVSYAYGNQGCQGNIAPFCVDKTPTGAASAWYREGDNDTQVVEFGYKPALSEDWKPCDCDGPLACLCTSTIEECPDRLEDFCGFITTELGCGNVTFMDVPICAWLLVSPEGPQNDMCAQNPGKYRCLPALDAKKKTCTQIPLPPYFGVCNDQVAVDPVFWREANDIIEIVQTCGPTPIGFTQCESIDTPEQPDECGCQCQ